MENITHCTSQLTGLEQLEALKDAIDDTSEGNPFIHYLRSLPYDIFRTELYTSGDLFDQYDPDDADSFSRCFDTRVYQYVVKTGKLDIDPFEVAARSLHDFSIRVALRKFLSHFPQRRVVGIMGGHSLSRASQSYRMAVDASKRLTEMGFLMISGGGPGAMEATHLGAWMAGRSEAEVDEAIRIVSQAPTFQDPGWLDYAFMVKRRFPLLSTYMSLAIPTWFYGHEPPSAFATHVAKLFENNLREDTLLSEAYGGLIFMEGSAGTLQEIFQEAVQNHYETLGFASPMIFVGQQFWTEKVPIVPFMHHMIEQQRYNNLHITLTDNVDQIVTTLTDFYSAK